MTTGRHTAPRRAFTTPFGEQPFGLAPEGVTPPEAPAVLPPNYRDVTEVDAQDGDGVFRRTRIRRSRASIARSIGRISTLTLEMNRAELGVYPNPDRHHCGGCAYRPPCIAETDGEDPAPVLAGGYRLRSPDETDSGERLLLQQIDKNRRAAYGGAAFR